MSKSIRMRWLVGLTTLFSAGFMASGAMGALTLPVDPFAPIPGVFCPGGSTQLTDTSARVDTVCTISLDTWKELGGDPTIPPEVIGVDTGFKIIPVDPTDPQKIADIINTFSPDDEPSDWGNKFEDCQSNPALTFCQTDVVVPPQIPDPDGPDVQVDDATGETPSTPVGYHCDPKTWTSNDLVVQQTAAPLDGNGDPLDPIEVYTLNPAFPAQLLPLGDSTQDPPLPSFLATRTGVARVGTADLPYWLDDPRGDNSAYIDSSRQGCVSIKNTAPTQAAADSLAPSSALPDSGDSTSLTISWSAVEQTIANNGGAAVTGYEVQTLKNGLVVDGKTCTKAFNAGDSCTVTGLTTGTVYTFKVRAINSVGSSPWSAATEPLAPNLPSRRARQAAAAATKFAAVRAVVAEARTLINQVGALPTSGNSNGSVTARTAKAKKPTPPGPPTAVTMTQTTGSANPWPNSGIISVKWKAPASNGGKPITGYLVTASQAGVPGTKTCTTPATVVTCNIDGLKKIPNTTVTTTVQAINSVGKSAAAKGPAKFTFNVTCLEYSTQLKCVIRIKAKTVLRMTGRKTEPAEEAGNKWRVQCGYAPTVGYAKIRIKNPMFPKNPTASPSLTLGESFSAICRISIQQVTPVLTTAQKALVKKGYVAIGLKVTGLPSKGSAERPVGLPFSIARVENLSALPKNGGLGPDGTKFALSQPGPGGATQYLDSRKLMSDANGLITWIGIVKKAGTYPVSTSWPFYKPGKVFIKFPKSKATK